MDEDLLGFLRSREVPEEDIMKMQRDKVDKAVLSIMTDNQMAKYIPSYGDRVAVLSFCQQAKTSSDKETLLQKLRDKIGARKMKSKTKGGASVFQKQCEGMARQGNNAGEKTSRKIELGWLHFSKDEYHQVRTKNGGGTRHATVEKTTTVSQILEIGKELFFPNGSSTKGRAEDLIFDVCDFKRNQIPMDDTVGRLYEQTKLKLLRFYICTKNIPSTEESSSEVDECSEHSSLSVSITEGVDAQLTKSRSNADLTTDLVDHEDASVSGTSEQSMHFQMQPRNKKQRLFGTVKAQDPGKHHYFNSTPKDNKKLNTGQWQNPNSSDDDSMWNCAVQPSADCSGSCLEIVDLTSDLCNNPPQIHHEHICHETTQDVPELDEADADTVEWHPEDELGGTGGDEIIVITWNYNKDATEGTELNEEPSQNLHLPLSSSSGLPPLYVQSIEQEEMLNTLDSGPHELPSNSNSQLSPSATDCNSENPESPRRASIRRVKVVEDLLAVFMDNSIMKLTLKMDFVNEKAIDDAGVSRDVYTAFWEQLLEQCEGETERVPRLRPDFCEAEWQAIGRIWVKGLLDHGVMPVRLSKAFILGCIHGIDAVDVDVLMTSFLNYLPPVERSAVEKALQGTMEESDEEDLLDLFTRMGSHSLPPKNNLEAAIHTMAHKAILQEPKYIVDCFSTPMAFIKLKLPDKESVLSLYDSKKATGKRVSQLFETTKVVMTQREQTTMHHLQRYVKNADQNKAEKILRFCTGSSVICVDKIMVSFNAETGLNRRPVAHTCGATLEIPCTYSSYPEFRTEFDNILSSNYLEMDIL